MARLDRFSPPSIAEENRKERAQAIMDEEDAVKADQDDLVAQLLEDKRRLRGLVDDLKKENSLLNYLGRALMQENQQLKKHLYGK